MSSFIQAARELRLLLIGEPHGRLDQASILADVWLADGAPPVDIVVVAGQLSDSVQPQSSRVMHAIASAEQSTFVSVLETFCGLVIHRESAHRFPRLSPALMPVSGAVDVTRALGGCHLTTNSVNTHLDSVAISKGLYAYSIDRVALLRCEPSVEVHIPVVAPEPVILDQSRALWEPPLPADFPSSSDQSARSAKLWPPHLFKDAVLQVMGGDEWGVAQRHGELLVAPGSLADNRYAVAEIAKDHNDQWQIKRITLHDLAVDRRAQLEADRQRYLVEESKVKRPPRWTPPWAAPASHA